MPRDQAPNNAVVDFVTTGFPDHRLDQMRVAISDRVLHTSCGQSVAVATCVSAVLAFQYLQPVLAYAFVVAITVVGLIAAVRRVPLALWSILGIALAVALVRAS